MDPAAVTVSRGDAVGCVLLIAAGVFAVVGYFLSKRGMDIDRATSAVADAAKKTQEAAAAAQTTASQAQTTIAQATGEHADQVAASTASVAQTNSVMQDQLSGVNDALSQLTGNQAPARVMWALTALCLVGAFISFGLIAASLASTAAT